MTASETTPRSETPGWQRGSQRVDGWIERHARFVASALYVGAVVLRWLHWEVYKDSLLAHVFLMDEAYYHAEAWNLVRGVPLLSDSWFMTPVYPYFLSLVFRFTGDSPPAAYAVQMLVGAIAAPLAFILARRLMSNTWALVAGFAVASFAPMIFFESLFLVEWFVLVTWLAATTLLVRAPHSRVHVLSSGVLLGLATLGRGSNALLVLPFTLWIVWRNVRPKRSSGALSPPGSLSWRAWTSPAVRQATRFVTGWGVVLLPLILYNATHAQQPVLLTANAGFNLYIGNGPDATGIFQLPDGIDLAQDPLALRYVQRRTGKPTTASEASRFWARETWDWVSHHPATTFRLFAWKLVLFWNELEIPQVESFDSVSPMFPLGHAPYWSRRWFFPFGLVGALLLFLRVARSMRTGLGGVDRMDSSGMLVASGVIVYALSIALFFITDRYRIAVMPQLIVLGLYTGSRIGNDLRKGARAAALGIALMVGVAALVMHPDVLGVDRAKMHRDLLVHDALRFAKAGAFDAAIEAYERALAESPDDVDLRDGVARMYARAGRDTLAIAAFRDLLRIQESARSWYNLGNVYRRSERHGEAIDAYRHALELDPRREAAWNNLGESYRARGDTAAAADAYRHAIAIVPGHEQALNNLGALRAAQGDARAAEAHFRAALAANPRYVPAWTNLAILLSGTARYREALQAWRTIETLDPDNTLARRALDEAAKAGLIPADH